MEKKKVMTKIKISTRTLIILSLIFVLIIFLITPQEIIKKAGIIGAVVTRVFITGLETNYTCNINLSTGLNLISVSCKLDNNSIDSVLNQISGKYSSIYTYDINEEIDHWKVYNPTLPKWVINDLNTINDERGYWIRMNEDSNLILEGIVEKPKLMNLYIGWNLIGYPSNESKNITQALSSISGSYSIVYAYNASSGNYIVYNPNLDNNTLTDIEPNRGYWVNMTTNDILIIN
jgi:hypothetical protein